VTGNNYPHTLRKEDLSIIVVDDLQFSREVVKSGLGKSGFSDIRTASSADEALYLLNQRRADVVLADFWMPGMNGLEMTDLIRRWDENNDRYTGIVLLTAEDTASSIVVAFDRGVDDFISKSASSRYLRVKQNSLQDAETNLPNRTQLELHIESLIEHCNTRGGGLGVGLIEVSSSNNELRLGTLKTIANSIQLSLRPMDMVSRFNINTFAVSVYYQDPQAFNPDLFDRLIQSIKRHTMQTTDQGKQLHISIGVWHGHELDETPSTLDILSSAHQALAPIK
jgi:PleD family two-component response regulator